MQDNPLVSIVLTTLNGARYLRQSIDSCLMQTYSNIELIVVDGGSTDDTAAILASYADERLRIVEQPNNEGRLPGALNLGLTRAHGTYLTWHQDDCYYAPNAIERMVVSLEINAKVGHVYSDWWQIRENGQLEYMSVPPPSTLLTMKYDAVGVCFLIRRQVREAIGHHSVQAYPSQDYDYRLRIAQRFQAERIQEPLYYYRLHTQSLTGRFGPFALARKDVATRLALGISDARQARIDLADIDIADAFANFQNGHLAKVVPLVLSALRHSPICALNRGVWAILVKSCYGIWAAQPMQNKDRIR